MKKKVIEEYSPLISIVIPVYNRQNVIGRLLEVLKQQTYQNLEIICIDDGSTDQSKSVIQRHMEADPRIILKEKENGGAVSAVCLGIYETSGDYVCFIDSDDLVGKDYIYNFVNQLDEKYDFVAFGFYYEDGICKKPYYLKESRIYSKEQLEQYRDQVLIEYGSSDISNRFFISRWNKMYSRECILKILPGYEKCIGLVLGEDSVFSHLLIKYAKNGKTIQKPNSYFYDVSDNGSSVMRDTNYIKYINACEKAYEVFKNLLKEDKFSNRQALYIVYYHISSIFSRMFSGNRKQFDAMYTELKKSEIYICALKRYIKDTKSKKQKIMLGIQIVAPTGKFYRWTLASVKKVKKKVGAVRSTVLFLVKNLKQYGFKKTLINSKYQNRRIHANEDLRKELPKLERQISPILEQYMGRKTDLQTATIEKNVFVFWWDGFETAPFIVKKCLERVKQVYSDAKIITISKQNFKEYTTINQQILEGFENKKISIQTFSDILRFNLLKNHGGLWIDATIYFLKPYPIFEQLENKSYESFAFKDTLDFLIYKENKCSWSSYLQAARKGAVLIDAMDCIFQEYYLKYGDYSIYFFMDAALMICKIMGIDDHVLDKVNYCEGSAFSLSKLLDKPYDNEVKKDLERLPQKLYWWYNPKNEKEDTFFNRLIMCK